MCKMAIAIFISLELTICTSRMKDNRLLSAESP